jgi:hypothetical protein
MVNDLDDRVRASNADVEYRHDVAVLGHVVVGAEPSEIEHVGNTWQYGTPALKYSSTTASFRSVSD